MKFNFTELLFYSHSGPKPNMRYSVCYYEIPILLQWRPHKIETRLNGPLNLLDNFSSSVNTE